MDWWSVPGPRRFVERIEAQVSERSVVLVGIPADSPSNFYLEIEARISTNRELMFLCADARPPVEHFCDHIGLHNERPSVSAIASSGEMHGRVIVITDVAENNWHAWSSFFVEFAQASRNKAFVERSAILCVVKGQLALAIPKPEPGLAVSIWDDVSSLDMLVYAAHVLGDRHDRRTSVRAAIIAGLAQFDPAVVDILANETLESLLHPDVLLDAIAHERKWSGTNPSWWNGAVMLLDGSPVFHIAHLAGRGRLNRVLWHAQVASLFASLEERRLSIIDRFADLLSEGQGSIARARLEALEYSEILTRLRQCREVSRLSRDEGYILEEVDRLRLIRNRLAHAKPLSIDQLSDSLLYDDA